MRPSRLLFLAPIAAVISGPAQAKDGAAMDPQFARVDNALKQEMPDARFVPARRTRTADDARRPVAGRMIAFAGKSS